MAEGQGFEPWEPLDSSVFKTGAFDHSATPPKLYRGLPRQDVSKFTLLWDFSSPQKEGEIIHLATLVSSDYCVESSFSSAAAGGAVRFVRGSFAGRLISR